MPTYIYPTANDSYLKVSPEPVYHRKNHGHITLAGWLSAKPILVQGIALAGGDFTEAPFWEDNQMGAGKAGGTGYHSSAKFQNVEAAINYLSAYFEVVDQR